MNLYMVVMGSEIPSHVREAADSVSIGDAYLITNRSLLIRSSQEDPQQIKENLGIDVNNVGVVFKLNGSYSGAYFSNLWDWLRGSQSRSDD